MDEWSNAMTVRASAMSRASVDAVCSRPLANELEARSVVQVLEVGGWPVELRDRPEEVQPGVWVIATVLDHDTGEPVREIRFAGAAGPCT